MLLHLQKVLFATDFSGPAKQAEKYACAMAQQFGAELHLLHVVSTEAMLAAPDATSGYTMPASNIKEETDAAEKALVDLLDPAWAKDRKIVRSVQVGNPTYEIVQYAKDHEIELLVIGTHGRTGLTRLLLGSLAEKLVRLAPCPVLTVHPKDHSFLMET